MKEADQELLNKINEIDTATLAEGGSKMAELCVLEKRGMWEKGLAILAAYPDLEDGGATAGRPKKNSPIVISMNKVAKVTGRSTPTISKWIKLVMVIGKTKTAFDRWIKEAKEAASEKWKHKLLHDNTAEKQSKQVENELYLSLSEQIDTTLYTDEQARADIKMLFGYFKMFEKHIRKAIMNIVDGETDRAREELEKALCRMED